MTRNQWKFCIEEFDCVFGPGYLKAHPEIVAALIHVEGMTEAASMLGDRIDNLAEASRNDFSMLEQSADGMVEALRAIAEAIARLDTLNPTQVPTQPEANGGAP